MQLLLPVRRRKVHGVVASTETEVQDKNRIDIIFWATSLSCMDSRDANSTVLRGALRCRYSSLDHSEAASLTSFG